MTNYLFKKGQVPHNVGERNVAKLKGDKNYFTGKPCSNGHVALRTTANGSCHECQKEKQAERRANRTIQQIEKDNAYARDNIKKWLVKNPDPTQRRKNKAKWKAENVAYTRAWTSKRRASKMNRTPNWLNDGHLFEIECVYKYCNALRKIGLDYHVDHIVPLQGSNVSGLHVPWNLQVITAQENLSKGNQYHG
jgi:hypothetical protein